MRSILTFLFFLTGPLADGQPFVISANRQATIVVPNDDRLAQIGASRLANYIERVTGAAPRITNSGVDAGPTIILAKKTIPYFRPDGYRINTGQGAITITAPGSTGLKYGCYRLIREMRQEGRALRVPALSIAANPWLKTRELFVAEIEWHATLGETKYLDELRKKFDWQNWPIPKLQQYVDLVDAMGYNSLQSADGEAWVRFAGRFVTREELTRKVQAMYRRARENGMGTAFFLWSQEGVKAAGQSRLSPHIPEEFADTRANWELMIANHGPFVDRWVMHWADPGGCQARDCTIYTPQEATNQFMDLLRRKGFQSDVSFSLWALRGSVDKVWPGFQSDLASVVDAGVLRPEIGINLMRNYTAETALAIKMQHRLTGVWGWYTNDMEIYPSLHVHTQILDKEFHQLDSSAPATLDWYSLEDNDHILNLPSLYAGAQMLWDSRKSADEALHEFCGAVWGREAEKVEHALRAIAEVRCGPGLHWSNYPHDYMCRFGRGSSSPTRDVTLCEKALRVLGTVAIDSGFVPKLPLPVEPGELLGYIRLHLERVRDFARVRAAYDEALRPALEDGRFQETQHKMATLPSLPDYLPGVYGAGLETLHYGILRKFADTWQGRTFDDNLALGRKVTASSWRNTDPRFAPEHAVNGILCEFREEGWLAGAYGPAWLKIDLGAIHPVRSVRIYNRGYDRDSRDDNLTATPAKGKVFYAAEDPDPARGTLDEKESGYRLLGGFERWAFTNDPAAFQEMKAPGVVQARFIKVLIDPPANGQPAGCGEVEVR